MLPGTPTKASQASRRGRSNAPSREVLRPSEDADDFFTSRSHDSTRPPVVPRGRSIAAFGIATSGNAHQPFKEANASFARAARVADPSKSSKVFWLPTTPGKWAELNNLEHMDSTTINTLRHADSASEIRLPQFVALRTLWPNHRSTLMEHLMKLGFRRTDYEKRKDAMRQNRAWKTYIDILEENYQNPRSRPYSSTSDFPDGLGRFAIALENQFEIYEEEYLKKSKGVKPGLSSDLTARQLRPRPPPQTMPATPKLSLGSAKIEYETPGTPSRPVPLPAQDEAIVNIALIAFLQAIWRVNPTYDTCWTAHRKAFKFVPTLHEGEQGKSFTAVTDGHLKFPHSGLKNKSAAIVEVKAAHRKRQNPGKHHIYMQESAQMALWIAAEPESHWRAPLQSPTNEDAGKRMDDGYYRTLISQDRDQIFITLAQYKGEYLDYLQGKPATNEAFLRMLLFGPYNTFVPHHMESFGNEISELLAYGGASALEIFERERDHRPNHVGVPGGLQASDDVGKLEKQLSELVVSDKKQSTEEGPRVDMDHEELDSD